jgi:hypothetical protein
MSSRGDGIFQADQQGAVGNRKHGFTGQLFLFDFFREFESMAQDLLSNQIWQVGDMADLFDPIFEIFPKRYAQFTASLFQNLPICGMQDRYGMTAVISELGDNIDSLSDKIVIVRFGSQDGAVPLGQMSYRQ